MQVYSLFLRTFCNRPVWVRLPQAPPLAYNSLMTREDIELELILREIQRRIDRQDRDFIGWSKILALRALRQFLEKRKHRR